MTEAELQKSIVNYLRLQENLGLVTFTAVTNNVPRGGEIAMRQQKKFKSLGLRPGFPDMLVFAKGGICEAWEIKLPGEALKGSQEDWEIRLSSFGFGHRVIRSVDHAIMAVQSLMGKVRANATQ